MFTTCVNAEFSTKKGWYCSEKRCTCSKSCYRASPIKDPAEPGAFQITTLPFGGFE